MAYTKYTMITKRYSFQSYYQQQIHQLQYPTRTKTKSRPCLPSHLIHISADTLALLRASTVKQYAGWSINSGMAEKYIHYFGNESCESLLEAYGIVTKNNSIDTLNPKICPNCNEGNTQDARFCSKCKMIMSYEGYQDALESQKQKEDEITDLKKRQERFELLIQSLIDSGQLKPTANVNKK